ncbi:MAG: helix-hairpin-helix domain-containing protein [archaeon]
MDKRDDLTELPNIGKKIAEKLRKIGVKDKNDFLKRDPYVVFEKLRKELDPGMCRCALASIVGAKQGRVWHEITKESAEEFDKRYPKHNWRNKC